LCMFCREEDIQTPHELICKKFIINYLSSNIFVWINLDRAYLNYIENEFNLMDEKNGIKQVD
jgi:hypothetical protein